MNLGVIVLDTLRYDTALKEMPGLYERADRVFTSMYTTSRWTTPAHASLFTGSYPTEVGTHAENKHLKTQRPTLAERLRSSGFETIALTENVNIDRFFGFDRGFDQFHRSPGLADRPESSRDEFDWQALEAQIPESGIQRPMAALYRILQSDAPTLRTLSTGLEMFLSDNQGEETIDWAAERIESLASDPPSNLFLFANFMSCHYPYEPPPGYATSEPLAVQPLELTVRDEPVSEDEQARQLDCYRGCARYLDDALPAVIDAIDWDLLFVISDHGELFGEHGLWGHQYGVYEELTHVPAIAMGNEVPDGNVTEPTSILDVHRTLLDVAGVDVDDSVRGASLLDDVDRGPAYAESVRSEWYNPEATGIEAKVPPSWGTEHYMLRTADGMLLVDKDGTRAVDSDTGERLPMRHQRELREAVDRIRAGRRDFTADTATPETVPTEIEERLESLGYR